MPKFCAHNIVYAKYLLSFWESGILAHAREGAMLPAPTKTLTTEPLTSFPSRQHLRVVTTNCWS